jgi:hypothetical protein
MAPSSPPLAAPPGLLGTWSAPTDRPAQVALALAAFLLVVALVPRGPRWLANALDFAGLSDIVRARRFVTVAAFVAAFLSLGYIAFYLRGGPRAPEAATYWLQGRAMSHGELTWAAPDPTASFRATYLLSSLPGRLSGILPPAFSLLLAAGFLVGAPMLVGPLVAAALVVSTWLLAHELATAAGERNPARAEAIARIAVGLSIVSAALRHDTADIVPGGAAAMFVAVSIAAALRARRTAAPPTFGAAGVALGLLLAAEPAASVVVGAALLILALGSPDRRRSVSWLVVAALPGALLLLAANRAATGHAFASPATGYLAGLEPHALAHTARVRALAAIGRLRGHAAEAANFEPLTLMAIVPLIGKTRSRVATLLAVVVAALVTTSLLVTSLGAPGSAIVVPIEQALVGLAIVRLFPDSSARAATAAVALALAGFALHTSRDHQRIAAADRGRPTYEPDVAREANVTHGLLFFDDDEGYEVASDPGVSASHGVEAVRMRGDDHDRLLYDELGHPPVHRYVIGPTSATASSWVPPGGSSDVWRFEAESDWPPLVPTHGWAEVITPAAKCASSGLVLELTPDGDAEASMMLELPVPRGTTPPARRTWTVVPRVLQQGGTGRGTLIVVLAPGGPPLARWSWSDSASAGACTELPGQSVELGAERRQAWLVVTAQGGPVGLDKTTLRPR